MDIYKDHVTLLGVKAPSENPLPKLRDKNEHLRCDVDPMMPVDLKDSFGNYCGKRVLPYKMQDGYSRELEEVNLKTIVLENDHIKATFLPEYGGRLYSLFNKTLNRELLSVNPVLQLANLGLRNAWFSGGIEWNMAHHGHSYLTLDLVHFARVKGPNGEDLLRLYEYERVKKLYYQIDFYIPKDADYLVSYTKIINVYSEATPLYYWSNIALSELNNARVFSEDNEVIYTKPCSNEKGEMFNKFSYGEVPRLEGLKEDVSYPRRFDQSIEYFFQTKDCVDYPWEAVVYDDAFLFYECSSKVLKYRKMFCWGIHDGGRKWQAYLAGSNTDKYVEIQAGIFPSQLHSNLLEGFSSVEFMQVFGGIQSETSGKFYDSYEVSKSYVKEAVFSNLGKNTLACLKNKMMISAGWVVDEVLHHGRGWAYLEELRQNKEGRTLTPKSMKFTLDSISEDQRFFLKLLEGKLIQGDHLRSFMIDIYWEKYLLKHSSEEVLVHLAIMYSENGHDDKAIKLLLNNNSARCALMYTRTLAAIYNKMNKPEQARIYYDIGYKKIDIGNKRLVNAFLIEYLQFLFEQSAYKIGWTIIKAYKDEMQEELKVISAKFAFEMKDYIYVENICKLNLERIKEGDNTLMDLWFKLQGLKIGETDIKEIRKVTIPPRNIDFRML